MESAVEGKGRTASDGTDSESNSFDKRDDMSEDELVVLGGKIDDSVDNVNIDESEDNRSKQGVKRRRKRVKMKATAETERSKKAKSKVWDAFTKVTVPDTTEKGKMISKAKCNYCKKLYSYIQGSTTSHLSRHMRICAVYLKHVAKQQDQSLLNFAPSTAGSTFSTGGRTLDDYRSSLRPSMVEALVCSSSWIRGTHDGSMIYMEEDDEDNVENIMFPKSLVESN